MTHERMATMERIIHRIAELAAGLGVKLRLRRAPEPMPATTGTPPSASFRAAPADPAEHAVWSAHEWEDVAEAYADKARRILRAIADRENQ
jgi:hypothetical protein